MTLRSEKEKMLAGERYNCLDAALENERQSARELLRSYNQSAPTHERRAILESLVGQLGQNSPIEPPFFCSYGKNMYIRELQH
jgi:maltose O-acetyltransferase